MTPDSFLCLALNVIPKQKDYGSVFNLHNALMYVAEIDLSQKKISVPGVKYFSIIYFSHNIRTSSSDVGECIF